jgi:hypothetical protein
MVKPPMIIVQPEKWSEFTKTVASINQLAGQEKAFGLFCERRGGKIPAGYKSNHYRVKEVKEITLKRIGGTYVYADQKLRGFYPNKGLRYAGALEIRDNLKLLPIDAYWMGRELIDFYIFIRSPTKTVAYWMDHETGVHEKTEIKFSDFMDR